LQSVAKIGTESTKNRGAKWRCMNSRRTSPQKTSKGNIRISTNEMLHTCISVRTQWTRVYNTHGREATNYHQNNQAINQLSHHRSQRAPILHSEGVVLMDRLDLRRAKQSGSAAVRIEFTLLSSQCKIAREWKTSTHMRHIGVRANTCDRHTNWSTTRWINNNSCLLFSDIFFVICFLFFRMFSYLLIFIYMYDGSNLWYRI
jgi:hypothetical protein